MKNTIRIASFALVLVALIAGATVASSSYTLEAFHIEETPTGEIVLIGHTNAPQDHWIAVQTNFGYGPVLLAMQPVNPCGMFDACFPHAHPDNCVQLLSPDGIEVLKTLYVIGGGIEGGYEFD